MVKKMQSFGVCFLGIYSYYIHVHSSDYNSVGRFFIHLKMVTAFLVT